MAETKVQKYTVSLPHSADRVIEAASQAEAIAIYKETMGIVRTQHDYVVSAAPAGAVACNAAPDTKKG